MTSNKDSIFYKLGEVADENIAIVDKIIEIIKILDPDIVNKKNDKPLSPEAGKLVGVAERVLNNNKKLVKVMKKYPRMSNV